MATAGKKSPTPKMTQAEKVQLADKRVRERLALEEKESKRRENDGSILSRARKMLAPGAKPEKLPMTNQAREQMDKDEMMRDIDAEKKAAKGEKETRQLRAFKRGGMVTARGQGKVTRKGSTRMC
jgi:hypothetical protein